MNWSWEIIGIAVGIVASVLAGVWFILNKVFNFGKFSHKVDEMDKRTCHAACDLHGEDISGIKGDVKMIRDDMATIKSLISVHDKDIENIKIELSSANDSLTKVTSLLLLKYKDAGKIFSFKNSPRQLNEIGKKVFTDIKGEEFLQANKDFLFAQIDNYHPKTALDVENASHAVCAVSTDNEIFNNLKDFVYNSPSYKLKDADGNETLYDLAMSDVCFILSIPLRDMYLVAHPEILSE